MQEKNQHFSFISDGIFHVSVFVRLRAPRGRLQKSGTTSGVFAPFQKNGRTAAVRCGIPALAPNAYFVLGESENGDRKALEQKKEKTAGFSPLVVRSE